MKVHKTIAHPSPHTGDVSGESYAKWPVAREGNNWTRDLPGKRGDLFFGRSSPPKTKGDRLLSQTSEAVLVRAHIAQGQDFALAVMPSSTLGHVLRLQRWGRPKKLTKTPLRMLHPFIRPSFPYTGGEKCIPSRRPIRNFQVPVWGRPGPRCTFLRHAS